MYADIHEGPECRDICNHAFQYHAGLQISQRFDPLPETCRLEFRTRVSAWLFQLDKNVPYRRHPELFIGKISRCQSLQERRLTHHVRNPGSQSRQNTFNHRVGLWVHGGPIQGVVAIGNA